VVLKVRAPGAEAQSEIAALAVFQGDGAVRLLDALPDAGALLLERVTPGAMLCAVGDDDRAMALAAELMMKLWRPPPERHGFRLVADWGAVLTGPTEVVERTLPQELIESASVSFRSLVSESHEAVLLHADLHQFNILDGGRRGRLAIDPKGAVGPPGYELGPLINNCLLDCAQPKQRLQDRVRRLSSELSLGQEQVLGFAYCGAVLAAAWHAADATPGLDGALQAARLMREVLR
jgi:streptomycin 6-kinase